MEVTTTFDVMQSSFDPDFCPTVSIEYEAHYDSHWELLECVIISISEVSPSGAKRELALSSIDEQDMKWAKACVTKDAEERWEEAKRDEELAKGDSDRDFEING